MKANKQKTHRKTTKIALSALSMAVSCALSSAYASDLEIYNHNTIAPELPSQPNTQQQTPAIPSGAKPVLMLVLNIGLGMGLEDGSFKEDYGVRSIQHCVVGSTSYRAGSHKRELKSLLFYDENGNKTERPPIRYQYETCDDRPTRISVLKEEFLKFLTNPNTKISEYKQQNNIQSPLGKISDFKIGLASNFSFNGPNGGQILYPAEDMTDDHRYNMAKQIALLSASGKGATPLALTIGETIAYFSGGLTNTSSKSGNVYDVAYPIGFVDTEGKKGPKNQWYRCVASNGVRLLDNGDFDLSAACPIQFALRSNKDLDEQPFKENDNLEIQKKKFGGGYIYHYATLNLGNKVKNNPTKTFPFSGFRLAHPDSRVLGNSYKTPLSPDNECAANGIYFLSDGDAFDVASSKYGGISMYVGTLERALSRQSHFSITRGGIGNSVCAGTLRDATTTKEALGSRSKLTTLWSCAGEMAKAARATFDAQGNLIKDKSFRVTDNFATDPDKRVFNADVRFASVGYGGGLKELKTGRRIKKEVILPGGVKKKDVEVYDCDSFRDVRARNMCKLGERGAGYGEGGFYYVGVEDNDAVTESVVNFMFSLTAPQSNTPSVVYPPADRTPTSTGAMSTPIDPLTGSDSAGFAYLPILDPMPGVTTLWNGNLKKYAVQSSKMMGKNDVPVIENRQGRFNTSAYDYWNKDGLPDGALPQKGGTYSQLFNYDPNLITNYTNISINSRNLWVDGGSRMVRLTTRNMATELAKIRSDAQTISPLLNTFITKPSDESDKTLGAVLHSKPQLITYEIGISENGDFDPDTRKDSVLYGSMDGALHLVDNKTGQELFTFVPQEMLDLQPNALNKGSTNDHKVPHGVDGPWSVNTNYIIHNKKYKADKVIASGGLRMGGSKYYSLDITDSNAPKHLYTVGSNYGKKLQDSTVALQGTGGKSEAENAAYARMGQSWAKPSVGYVRSGGKKIMVDFLAGGYDYGYESADYVPTGNAQGNAVYMVQVGEETIDPTSNQPKIKTDDANSGKLLWWATQGNQNAKTSASNSLQASTHPDMKHSVVGQIRVLDRDNDGYTDHIYYSDLGGRVWRADLDNKKPENCSVEGGQERCNDNFSVTRVVKVLDVSDQKSGTDTAPRFYERPLVTFTKEVGGSITAMVTVGTGNRSLPVSATRQTPDAIYTFLDKDIASDRQSLYNSQTALKTENLTTADLIKLTFTENDKQIKTQMKAGTTQGWYYPLSKWVNDSGDAVSANGLKSFNELDALDGYLFATVYNPSAIITGTVSAGQQEHTSQSGSVVKCGVPSPPPPVSGGAMKGVTQRMLMCLPFGNCANDINSPNPDAFRKIPSVDIGIGIIDNIITKENGKGGGLTGTLTTECTGSDCAKKSNITGVPASPELIGRDLTPVLNPRDWWEK